MEQNNAVYWGLTGGPGTQCETGDPSEEEVDCDDREEEVVLEVVLEEVGCYDSEEEVVVEEVVVEDVVMEEVVEEEVDCDDREEEVVEEEVDCDDREEDVEEPQSTVVLLLLSAVVASWFIQPADQAGTWVGPVWAGSSLISV